MRYFEVGVDEAGRGPLAGPLVAAAVVLPDRHKIKGLSDSKLLNIQSRKKIAAEIRSNALNIGIGWASEKYIDRYGLTMATRRAMKCALSEINIPCARILIDGNYNYLSKSKNVICKIGGDGEIESIMAASIIAKVARDNYMRKVASLFPEYGFETHVGYGTAEHRKRIKALGPCVLHRRSFSPVAEVL